MKILKLHGTENSFLLCEDSTWEKNLSAWQERAQLWCHPGQGIGSDGLMVIAPSPDPNGRFNVLMLNPDGSLMGMCGNGIRCVTRALYRWKRVPASLTKVECLIEGRLLSCYTENEGFLVTVDMGPPSFEPSLIPLNAPFEGNQGTIEVAGQSFPFTAVSMGNPHCVIFCGSGEAQILAKEIGPFIEHHPFFPQRTNVEFVEVISRTACTMRVWERGAGLTRSCGTGACASVVAGITQGIFDESVTVELLGGSLTIRYEGATVFLSGAVTEVVEGELLL